MDVLDLIRPGEAPPPIAPFVPFSNWNTSEHEALRALGRVERWVPGTTIIAQGALDRSLLIVVEGELEVVRNDRAVYRVEAGNLVGELALVDGRPRSASVRASTAAAAIRICPEDVTRLAAVDPGLALKLAYEVARVLAARLRDEWD